MSEILIFLSCSADDFPWLRLPFSHGLSCPGAALHAVLVYYKELIEDTGKNIVRLFTLWYHVDLCTNKLAADFTGVFGGITLKFTQANNLQTIAFYLPLDIANWIKEFISSTSAGRKEEMSHITCFVWYMTEILGFYADYKPFKVVNDDQNMPDYHKTFRKWAAALADEINEDTAMNCKKRLVALVRIRSNLIGVEETMNTS
ncbi:hypothetical protein N0V93_008230 [Gnomoniopsis smithogilvyi]|uniref:Uncharacterized protein n=1 Tax=Gnomoniopsis smithogilvyi TaxID=1191159 RepID=A0A9W9CUJ4_9PEZI|nr:hypothetical protein N0V93_008230 [Gnomoniopsis smithogilvyi]